MFFHLVRRCDYLIAALGGVPVLYRESRKRDRLWYGLWRFANSCEFACMPSTLKKTDIPKINRDNVTDAPVFGK